MELHFTRNQLAGYYYFLQRSFSINDGRDYISAKYNV